MNAPRDMPLLAAGISPGMDVVGAPYLSVFCDDHAIPDTTMAGIYAKAKTQQWNAATDIDWQVQLDPDNPLAGKLRPGMSVVATVDTQQSQAATATVSER